VSLGEKTINNLRSNEPGAAGDEDFHNWFIAVWRYLV
jgi:hypothetical protein